MNKETPGKRLSVAKLALLALLAATVVITGGCDIQLLFVNQPST